MAIQNEWEMEHVPHSIYIQPLRTYDVWPADPNHPISLPHIQEINTFDTWRIVPISRPVIAPPVFRENYLDISGMYGSLDYSRAHTGLSVYGNRTGSWEFVVLNDYRPWEMAFSDIQHSIHGKRCLITLEDDLDYFYAGTLTLNEWRSDPGWSRIVINYNLDPFKYSKQDTEFNITLPAGESSNLIIEHGELGRAPVQPWLKCVPAEENENVKLSITFINREITNFTNEITYTKKNVYSLLSKAILSNESGDNFVHFIISDERDNPNGDLNLTLRYNRRYM